MHGKSSLIHHNNHGMFKGIKQSFLRHSLSFAGSKSREKLPDCFEITAWTDDGTIMGMRHKKYPAAGCSIPPGVFYDTKRQRDYSEDNFLEGEAQGVN